MPANPRRLYRRVHKGQLRSDGTPTRGAFTPSDDDTDGLSFYDASRTTPEELMKNARKPANEYRVLGLSEADLWKFNLTVTPTGGHSPGELPGHVVVPEFTTDLYRCDKGPFRPIQDGLLDAARFVD